MSSSAPPPRSGRQWIAPGGGGKPKPAWTVRTSPIAPAAISSRTRWIAGLNRIHIASMRKRPCAVASAASSRASAAVVVNAFSSSTCLPADRARRATSTCVPIGVPM